MLLKLHLELVGHLIVSADALIFCREKTWKTCDIHVRGRVSAWGDCINFRSFRKPVVLSRHVVSVIRAKRLLVIAPAKIDLLFHSWLGLWSCIERVRLPATRLLHKLWYGLSHVIAITLWCKRQIECIENRLFIDYMRSAVLG